MVWDCEMAKSFTGFLQCLAIRRLPECFVKVSAGITEAKIQNTEMSSKRQWYAVTAWKVYKNAPLGIFDQLECLRNMFGAGVGDAGYKLIRKFSHFFWKFRVAIDLHEESSFIAQAIFNNPLTQQFVFTLVCISTKFMGSSFVKNHVFRWSWSSFIPRSMADASMPKDNNTK